MKYKLLTAEYPSKLEEEVNKLIKAGWTPQGGVSVCLSPVDENLEPSQQSDYWYAQAMIQQ